MSAGDSSDSSASGIALSGSDITVISSDGIQFKVHKANLACASTVFRDMLDVGGTTGTEVTLTEPAKVLARILPLAYPAQVSDFGVISADDVDTARAVSKYNIGRGLEALSHSLRHFLAETSASGAGAAAPTPQQACLAAQIAHITDFQELFQASAKNFIPHLSAMTCPEIESYMVSLDGVDAAFAAWFVSPVIG